MNIIKKILYICIIITIFVYLISVIISSSYITVNKKIYNQQLKDNYENELKKAIKKLLNFNLNTNSNNKNNKNSKNNSNNTKSNVIENYANSYNPPKRINPNLCLNHHECIKNKVKFCNYGLTNYIYPEHLSKLDKKIFMSKIHKNFTKQDYINWLNCFRNDTDKLNYWHYNNLLKIKNNDYEINIHNKNKKDKKQFFNIYEN